VLPTDANTARAAIAGDQQPASTPVTGGAGAQKAQLAATLARARGEYVAAARQGSGGRRAQALYAEEMDAIVRQLVDAARVHSAQPLVVCALGGYGRRTLCLHSDVDLLILFERGIEREEARVVNGVLQPLWDLQLTVGHHVRELSDFTEVDADNIEFQMALLDARVIAGDETLFEELRRRSTQAKADLPVRISNALLELVDERHAEFNDTIYQLEPDVKNAPGGLRDIAAARYLRTLEPAIFPSDADRMTEMLIQVEEFLLRVRSVLHTETGRDANMLTHELQERVADALGCPGDDLHRRVESLMGAYCRHARVSARALSRARQAVRPAEAPAVQRLVGRQFEIAKNGIRFVDPDSAASRPSLWLEIFRLAIAHGCGVAEEALDAIEQNVDRCTSEDFVGTEAERQQLRNFFYPRPGLYARLSEMHDCGLLNRILPELKGIHGRVLRDFYHRYTVDEHTLLTIRGLETLWHPATPSRKRFGALLEELRTPELLTLALLFHDIGKAEEGNHAQASVRLARSAFDRMELPAEARNTVEFLIGHHLDMSKVAFRRDLDDPHIVERFAHLVGTEELLKMLCLMTLVDVEAVSSTTLTPWKEELLWRLYVDTYNHLTLGYGDELMQNDPVGLSVVLGGRPEDIPETELTQFLNGLPRRYVALFGLASIYRHVRLARGIHRDEVHTILENHDDVWELTIVTVDKPYLFSNVAGVLSYFGMDILRAQAMTTPDGFVLDVFEFSDAEAFLRQNPGASNDICRMLDRVVAGSIDVPTLLRGRERSTLYRRRIPEPPRIHADNEHSRKYTVLEIVADDGPGLLYRMSRVVSEHGCDLDLALIGTEGRKAIDVLHVTKAGRKLEEGEQTQLKGALERVLEAADETH
jgi:[protein-PII] uridylyltransferase